MSDLRINFSDVKETSYELILAGKYPIAVTNVEISDVMNPGKDAPDDAQKLEVEVTIQPNGTELNDKWADRKVWTNITLYGGGLGRLKNFLKALGVNVDGTIDLEDMVGTGQLLGKKCLASIRIRPAQGEYQARNDISGFSALEGASNSSGGSSSLLPG